MLRENEYHSFYSSYVSLALNNSTDIVQSLQDNKTLFLTTFSELSEAMQTYAYAEGKWTIKEMIQHLIDAERVFAYRAMRIARNDQTELSGFDENAYVDVVDANARAYKDLIGEFTALRASTIFLFDSFTEEELLRMGRASNSDVSVRGIGYIISGHVFHHINIVKERYL